MILGTFACFSLSSVQNFLHVQGPWWFQTKGTSLLCNTILDFPCWITVNEPYKLSESYLQCCCIRTKYQKRFFANRHRCIHEDNHDHLLNMLFPRTPAHLKISVGSLHYFIFQPFLHWSSEWSNERTERPWSCLGDSHTNSSWNGFPVLSKAKTFLKRQLQMNGFPARFSALSCGSKSRMLSLTSCNSLNSIERVSSLRIRSNAFGLRHLTKLFANWLDVYVYKWNILKHFCTDWRVIKLRNQVAQSQNVEADFHSNFFKKTLISKFT